MKVVLILISMILFATNSNYAFAKDTYFNCGEIGGDWKYSKSFFGDGKMYYDKGGEWIKIKKSESDIKITDDRIIFSNFMYISKKCKDPFCRIKTVFDLVYEERGKLKNKYTTRKNYALSDCEVEEFNSCKSYKAGHLFESFSCKVK